LELVVAPDHPLARRRGLQLADVMAYPAVLPDPRTYTHRILKATLEAQGLVPKVRLATNYLETLKMLTAIGLGWSVLPASMLDASIQRLALPQWSLRRELGAVWHAGRTRSRAARELLRLLDEAGEASPQAPEQAPALS
jgi:DNA-binding transcriptional LysR family regulator